MQMHQTNLLKVAFWLNLCFAIIELIGGYWIGSLAILSDALHDFGDSLSLGLAWYFQHLSTKSSDGRYSFGYARFSTLGALVTSVVLLAGSAYLIYESIQAFQEPHLPKTGWMMGFAVMGIVINGLAFKLLHRGKSLNEQTAAFHLLEDVLGWIAVLAGAAVMMLTEWAWIDPALSLVIALWIGIQAFRQMRKTSFVFLQAIPSEIDIEALQKEFERDPMVEEIHELRLWSLDGNNHVLSLHVVLHEDLRLSEVDVIRRRMKARLDEMGLENVTLQFETHKAC